MACPERAARIFTEDPERNEVAVVSAVGKSDEPGGDIKVTDLLGGFEQAVRQGDNAAITSYREAVLERNCHAYGMLGERALSRICDEAYRALQPHNRDQGFKWVGEWISARLFAELTDAVYVPSGLRFGGGRLLLPSSLGAIRREVQPVLATGQQVVTEGFFGYDSSRRVVTLPRGGSDISAIVYAGALNDGRWIHENYTDKDGILSADPGIVPRTRVIPEMTHEEVREKMHGATERNGVIHGDAIAYAARLGVEVRVKNTFNRTAEGTRIVSSRQSDEEHPVIGVSGKAGLAAIDIYDMGMANAEGYLARILRRVGDRGMSISNLPTSEDRLKIMFNSGVTDSNLEEIGGYVRRNAISGEGARVDTVEDEGAVYVIGQELAKPLVYTRILGKVAGILATDGLAIREVVSHEKSPSLALTVKGADVPRTIRLLHEELVETA